MNFICYIGPGLGIGTIVLVFLIGGIVVFSFGYIVWLKFRKYFKKNK